jgi:hypothetical protein
MRKWRRKKDDEKRLRQKSCHLDTYGSGLRVNG